MVIVFLVMFINFGIGVVSRILLENREFFKDLFMDINIFKIIVLGVNILVVG